MLMKYRTCKSSCSGVNVPCTAAELCYWY